MIARTKQVVALGLDSSYKKANGERILTDGFKDGNLITPDMYEALKELDKKVQEKTGNLFIIDLFRSWETQAEARKKYLSGKKKAFVAKPGGSFHNAGRAVDIQVKELNFSGDKEDWLQTFWDIAQPLGFHPIISIPDLDASECWHFDFPGEEWEDAYATLPYGEVAKCCALDIGQWDPDEDEDRAKRRFIQAQLIRLGYHGIGKVDGLFGPKTIKCLKNCGVAALDIESMANVLSSR